MAYTAILNLRRAWLIDPASPTGFSFTSGTRRTGEETDAVEGEVRQFAGGRRQLIVRDAVLFTMPIQFVNLSLADVAAFRSHKGALLLLRTVQGERVFGGYLQMSVATQTNTSKGLYGMAFDVTVQFFETSYVEAV